MKDARKALEESLKEMNGMRAGDLPKPSWSAVKVKLNKISDGAELLTGTDSMIEINPNNPEHRKWFDEE